MAQQPPRKPFEVHSEAGTKSLAEITSMIRGTVDGKTCRAIFAAMKEAAERRMIIDPDDVAHVRTIAEYVRLNPGSFTPDCRRFIRETAGAVRLLT